MNSSADRLIDSPADVEERYQDKIRRDRTQLLTTFPEEVWLLIMDYIEKEEDLESLCNSAIYFRDMKHPRREHAIAQKVLKIMLERSHKQSYGLLSDNCYDTTDHNGPSELEDNVPGTNLPWFKSQLNLRLVSRSFCRIVDEFYQNQPVILKQYNQSTRSDILASMMRKLNRLTQEKFMIFDDDDDEENEREPRQFAFLRHFRQTHEGTDRNPFLGRKVCFEFTNWNPVDPDLDIDFSSCMTLLSTYGHHIVHCSITGRELDFRMPYVTVYRRIGDLLSLLPNIKVLHLSVYGRQFGQCLFNQRMLEAEISSTSLPNMQQLDTLLVSDLRCQIFQEIIRTNIQISTIIFDGTQFLEESYDLCSTPLPNLKTLYYSITTRQDFENIASPLVNWSVTKLGLMFSHSDLKWQQIFSLIDSIKWTATVTDLELTLPPSNETDSKVAFLTLCFPCLKKLRLITPNRLFCLDFLLSLKDSLVLLDWRVMVDAVEVERLDSVEFLTAENGKLVKFLGRVELPLESGIWTHFSNLQRIHFEMEIEYPLWMVENETKKRISWSYSRI